MLSFEEKFTRLLNEKGPIEIPDEGSAPTPDEAFGNQLEPETNPRSFDTPANPEMNYKAKQKAEQLKLLHEWIGFLGDVVIKLNGLEPHSIQSQLNSAECETIFSSIARSETKKISRIAQDISGLAESMKSHLMSADTGV